jgi:hypothetical protein
MRTITCDICGGNGMIMREIPCHIIHGTEDKVISFGIRPLKKDFDKYIEADVCFNCARNLDIKIHL